SKSPALATTTKRVALRATRHAWRTQKKRHPQVPSQYRLRNESSATSVAHPSAAPLFQFVVLCDVEFPVANESNYTDGDKYHAYEEP
ncbi:hypothetical protein QVM41_28730, partial [Pseudomonas shirazica]|uniref:hypothetical protein n=1 Tax=Pseudomonas shirazica TaxID=1940636 RepID=UPI003524C070